VYIYGGRSDGNCVLLIITTTESPFLGVHVAAAGGGFTKKKKPIDALDLVNRH
jgi:hypothetical protein